MRDDVGWQNADAAFEACELIFNVIFTVELFFRLIVQRCAFFLDISNILDFLLVFITLSTEVVFPIFNIQTVNVSFARILRFGRIVRVLKVVRVMRVFRQLRILVQTIISSFGALAWSMLILFVIMLIAAMFLCQTLDTYIMDQDNPEAMRRCSQ